MSNASGRLGIPRDDIILFPGPPSTRRPLRLLLQTPPTEICSSVIPVTSRAFRVY